MKKIITIILAVIGVISVILVGRVWANDGAIKSANIAGDASFVDGMLNPISIIAYIVLAVILALVVLFALKNIVSNPANIKRTIMSVGAFLLLFAICYFALAKGVETPMRDDKILSAGDSKLVGAGLYMFYLLAIIAGGAMLFTGIKKMIK